MSHVHVIGAGLAGLAAALSLSTTGRAVTVYEAGSAAGGRCRSYFDRELGLRIDNGNHLLLSGNRAAFAYVDEIGSGCHFDPTTGPRFPFIDLKTNERWVLRPNRGRLPWWTLMNGRRVPGSRLSDYVRMAAITRIRDDTVVADSMRRGRLYWRLVEPLAIAALNTSPQVGLARMLGAVMRETLMQGGSACVPRFPRGGLSEALVDPAVTTLRHRGTSVLFNHRVGSLQIEAGRVTGLRIGESTIAVAPEDAVILATPPWIAAGLLPELTVPDQFEAILNIHFGGSGTPEPSVRESGFVGVLNGVAEWVFVKPDHVSVTVSAANAMVDEPAAQIARRVWPNVHAALGFAEDTRDSMPPFRVVKEKRATFIATAAQERRRPHARTPLSNLVLAGDWTATGLPATIEGAIRSGRLASATLLAS